MRTERIEWIREPRVQEYRAALFDFDGTLSLIRRGWQPIMYSFFVEVLQETPQAEDRENLRRVVVDFVDRLTGKQTIYQMIRLAEEIKKRGGRAAEPLAYKAEYHRRLWQVIEKRVAGLKNGTISRKELLVPYSEELLTALRERGLTLYLASGTDRHYVLDEVDALGLRSYFNGGIFGALDDYRKFSKAMVIKDIIAQTGVDGSQILGFGDGFVEIENVKAVGGTAVGVASLEENPINIDNWKRQRLLEAGADCIVPNFSCWIELISCLFPKK